MYPTRNLAQNNSIPIQLAAHGQMLPFSSLIQALWYILSGV